MSDHPGEAQIWADHHQRWSDDIAALLASIRAAFVALNRIHYAAPWRVSRCRSPR